MRGRSVLDTGARRMRGREPATDRRHPHPVRPMTTAEWTVALTCSEQGQCPASAIDGRVISTDGAR